MKKTIYIHITDAYKLKKITQLGILSFYGDDFYGRGVDLYICEQVRLFKH